MNTGCDEPEPYTVNEEPFAVPFDDEMYTRDAVTFCVAITLFVVIDPEYWNDPVPRIPDPEIVKAVNEPDVNDAIVAVGYAPTVTPNAVDGELPPGEIPTPLPNEQT